MAADDALKDWQQGPNGLSQEQTLKALWLEPVQPQPDDGRKTPRPNVLKAG